MHTLQFSNILKNIKMLFVIAMTVFFVERVGLFLWSFKDIQFNLISALEAFSIGFIFDISLIIYAMIPFALLFLAFPKFKNKKTGEKTLWIFLYIFNFIFIFFVLYMASCELFFWDEFKARFNFIAVDYLLYTTEVLKNIWESYPALKILIALVISSLLILMQINKRLEIVFEEHVNKSSKLKFLGASLVIIILNFLLINQNLSQIPKEIAYQEIAKNGVYSIFYSYFENQINYEQFYLKLDRQAAMQIVKDSFPNEIFSPEVKGESIRRDVVYPKTTSKKMNVILVLMESMGARFMNSYGSTENLTPNLDFLSKQGMFFNNIYATGTRTVRGIEAITLSIPPTPGQSIVRRPNNEKLITINSYFAKSNYDVQFLYGGFAYFDNMKYFFENNDAHVLDINSISSSDISFSNAWGVSDEDLYKFTIKNADEAFKNNTPFFQIVLTTSNHRPFTYPESKIDIPSGTGRKGAVKYADYAIGEFINKARSKPWFDDTLFVFVADHDAGVAGNADVNKKDYLIPLIFFAPKLLEPRVYSNLGSQIDVGPTLLGILNMSHESFGFGYDLRQNNPERAFISNYQKIGLLKKNFLTLLEPAEKFKQFRINGDKYEEVDIEKDELDSTISFYQTASHLFKDSKLKSKNEKLVITK